MQKYRLGNQPEEYELREDYLNWILESDKEEDDLLLNFNKKKKFITLFNPKKFEKQTLYLHQVFIKDAFPMSFFAEERFANWSRFAIVSKFKKSEKFIIPLH